MWINASVKNRLRITYLTIFMMNMYYHRIHLTLVASVDGKSSDSRIIIVKDLKWARKRLLCVLSVENWVLSSRLMIVWFYGSVNIWLSLVCLCNSFVEMGISSWKADDDADVSWPCWSKSPVHCYKANGFCPVENISLISAHRL